MVTPRLFKSKRFWAIVLLCVVLISIAGPVIWIAIPKPGINRQNFHRIRVGMTVDEVTGLMGCAPGKYSSPNSMILMSDNESLGEAPKSSTLPWGTDPRQPLWLSDGGLIIIEFDDNDRVISAGFIEPQEARIL